MTDPRRHPAVARVDGGLVTYRCGCSNSVGHPDGVMRRAGRCAKHGARYRDPATLDEAYYRGLGALDADAPARYVGELVAALGPLPAAPFPTALALEVGCGFSPYIAAIRAAGWQYRGLDPSRHVADWAWREHDAIVRVGHWEGYAADVPPGLIVAAHAFEHMADAPAMIAKAAGLLAPGGELWLVVPDDSDPVNPDHLCFFTPDSLRRSVESAGLDVVRLEARRVVPQELFIYCRARKHA